MGRALGSYNSASASRLGPWWWKGRLFFLGNTCPFFWSQDQTWGPWLDSQVGVPVFFRVLFLRREDVGRICLFYFSPVRSGAPPCSGWEADRGSHGCRLIFLLSGGRVARRLAGRPRVRWGGGVPLFFSRVCQEAKPQFLGFFFASLASRRPPDAAKARLSLPPGVLARSACSRSFKSFFPSASSSLYIKKWTLILLPQTDAALLRRSTTPALFSRSGTLSFTRLPGCSTPCSCRVALMKDSQAAWMSSLLSAIEAPGALSVLVDRKDFTKSPTSPSKARRFGRWSAWACLQKVLVDHVQDREEGGWTHVFWFWLAYRVVREHRDALHDGGPLSHGVVGHERPCWRQTPRTVACASRSSRTGRAQTARRSGRYTWSRIVSLPSTSRMGGCVGVANLGERGGVGHRIQAQDGAHQCPKAAASCARSGRGWKLG